MNHSGHATIVHVLILSLPSHMARPSKKAGRLSHCILPAALPTKGKVHISISLHSNLSFAFVYIDHNQLGQLTWTRFQHARPDSVLQRLLAILPQLPATIPTQVPHPLSTKVERSATLEQKLWFKFKEVHQLFKLEFQLWEAESHHLDHHGNENYPRR